MEIILNLHVKNYNGGPLIKIYNNDKTLFEDSLMVAGPHIVRINTDMDLPNKLVIEHQGKNMKNDTCIDSAGKIIDDKGFTIDSVKLNDVLLDNELYHFPFIRENGEPIKNNNYIGFNGKFVINIDKDNLYAWQKGWQRMLATNIESNFSYEEFRKEIFSND